MWVHRLPSIPRKLLALIMAMNFASQACLHLSYFFGVFIQAGYLQKVAPGQREFAGDVGGDNYKFPDSSHEKPMGFH